MTANRARWMIALALALTALAAPAARACDAYVANRQLVVYGSSSADSIGVVEDVGRNTLTVIVLDMTTYATVLNRTFRRSDVDTVYINPLDGDDYAYNFTTLPGSIEGWGGDDFLWGGTAGDDLWGDSSYYAWIGGNDTIHGQGGDDHIHGGPGDDALFGHGGTDRIEGGAGNDTLTQVPSTATSINPWGNEEHPISTLSGDDGDDVIGIGTAWVMAYGGFGFDRFIQGADVRPRSVQGGIYVFTQAAAFDCESWAYMPTSR